MKYSQFIDQNNVPTSELMRYANLAYRDVYAQIILSKEQYFTITTNMNIVSGQDRYDLPEDLYKLDGVDLSLDGGQRFLTMRPVMFAERNKFRSSLAMLDYTFTALYRYLIVGNKLIFIPMPTQNMTIQLWYTPQPVLITDLEDTVNLLAGCDEYMSLYIGAMMLAKEETDNSSLNSKRLEVLDQLKNSLKDRDQGSPSYVVDEGTLNYGAVYPWGGGF